MNNQNQTAVAQATTGAFQHSAFMQSRIAGFTYEPAEEGNLEAIRQLTRNGYDIQAMRISVGNRLAALIRTEQKANEAIAEEAQLQAVEASLTAQNNSELECLGNDPAVNISTHGIPSPEMSKEDREKEEKEAAKILSVIDREYNQTVELNLSARKLADHLKTNKCIRTPQHFALARQFRELREMEGRIFRDLEKALEFVPVYTQFLKHIRGIGPAMAGVIVSEIDIHRSRTVGAMWAYAGLDVVYNPSTGRNEGRSRRAEHLIDREYISADKSVKTRKSITFNATLKTKLMGVLASSFLRGRSSFAQTYYDYRFRLQNSPEHASKSDGHRHNMALRYMVKQFMTELYTAWRTIEGLEVTAPYAERKLGMSLDHHKPMFKGEKVTGEPSPEMVAMIQAAVASGDVTAYLIAQLAKAGGKTVETGAAPAALN